MAIHWGGARRRARTPPRHAFALLMIGAGFALAMTAPLELIYARRLGAGVAALAVYIAAPGLGMLFVDVLGSHYVPRLDARVMVAMGIACFGVSAIGLGLAPSYLPLLPARALQGFGGGLLMGAALQATTRLNPVHDEALVTFNSAFLFGGALGSPAGGFAAGTVAGLAGYRMTFGLCAVLALAVAVGVLFWLPPLPPEPGTARPRIGLPALSGPPGVGPALLLGTLGDFLRGGVVYTALPLTGQLRHMSTGTIGLAVGLLLAVDILTVRLANPVLQRTGPLPGLIVALTAGIGLAATLALTHGPLTYVLASAGFGVVVAAATIVPPLVLVTFHKEDAAAGLASFRVTSGVGMLAGSTGSGAAVVGLGPTTVFLVIGGVLVGAVALARRVDRGFGAPATA
jgi:predicted MFS family arabinose efflux permease